MKKIPPYPEMRKMVIRVINLFGAEALVHKEKFGNDPTNINEYELLSQACGIVEHGDKEFIDFVDWIEVKLIGEWVEQKRPREEYFGLWAYLYHIIISIALIGSIATVSDSNRRRLELERIIDMRIKKKGKHGNDEAALIDAIKAEHGDGVVRRPYKEAFAILAAVNQRLEQAGLKAVKVDVVRRRLEKWPALLKGAEEVED